jgi:CDP-diacylglycerol--serine O-phosphatidyltransferase
MAGNQRRDQWPGAAARRAYMHRYRVAMSWRQMIPTTVTLFAMLAGFLSILLTVEGMRIVGDPLQNYRKASLLIMLAMILDGVDGNLARWLKGKSEFGAELDTYVDLTAFGIAPAILIYAVTLQAKSVWRVILPSAVALSGVVRLARFKAKDPLRGQGGYAGLPITANAAWVSLLVYISGVGPFEGMSLNEGTMAIVFLVGIVLFISLQVTNIRYPKPTKQASLFIPTVILVCTFIYFGWVRHRVWAVRMALLMILLGLGYIFIGPLFVKGMAVHKARKEARLARDGENGDGENGESDE